MSGVEKADRRTRRNAILLIGTAAVIGSALIYAFEADRPNVDHWDTRAIVMLLGVALLPLLGFSVYFWRLGARVVAALRFPPPDAKVLRDTPILEGNSALRRGRAMQTIAALFAILAVLLGLILFRLAALLSAG